jgi:hypothetical protein
LVAVDWSLDACLLPSAAANWHLSLHQSLTTSASASAWYNLSAVALPTGTKGKAHIILAQADEFQHFFDASGIAFHEEQGDELNEL